MRLVHSSTKPKPSSKPPVLTARKFRDGSGWYVFVFWGDAPAEEVGHFIDLASTQEWINENAAEWVKAVKEGHFTR